MFSWHWQALRRKLIKHCPCSQGQLKREGKFLNKNVQQHMQANDYLKRMAMFMGQWKHKGWDQMCLWNGLTISLFPAGSLIEQLLFLQCKDFKVEEFSSLKSSKVYEGVQDLFLWLPNFLAFTMQQVFNIYEIQIRMFWTQNLRSTWQMLFICSPC